MRLVDSAFAKGHKRLCVQMPTGAGKTVVAAEVVRRLNGRVLYVVPSIEILKQTEKTLRLFGVKPELLAAGAWPRLRNQRVVLAMAQTLQRRMGMMHDSPWYPDVIVVDEAHRLLDAHMLTLAAFPVPSIALTATPVRLDGKRLTTIWPLTIQGPSIQELQKMGRLCPVHTLQVPIGSLKGLRLRGGDYEQGALEKRLMEHDAPAQVAAAWRKYLRGRRTLCFAPGRHLSEAIVMRLKEVGCRAVHVDATTPKDQREWALKSLAAGRIDVVSNCGLFIEGLDLPNVNGVINCTPTHSLTRWLQTAGRGMRGLAGKSDCILIDCGGCTARLGSVEATRDWRQGGVVV